MSRRAEGKRMIFRKGEKFRKRIKVGRLIQLSPISFAPTLLAKPAKGYRLDLGREVQMLSQNLFWREHPLVSSFFKLPLDVCVDQETEITCLMGHKTGDGKNL